MIGIFDSGSGGLTVLKALRERLPSADVVYFGDIGHAPYGERTHEELSMLTVQAIKRLQTRGASKIISACNSVSASMALSLFDAFDIAPTHMIEMVGPTVAQFRDFPGRILLCATQATIKSGIYQNAFNMVGKEIQVLALPGLAGAIEFGKPEEEIAGIIHKAFSSQRAADVVILGCTHYPLVWPLFRSAVPTAALFDPAVAVAERAQRLFWPQEVGEGTTQFLISQESQEFRRFVRTLFPDAQYGVEVVE